MSRTLQASVLIAAACLYCTTASATTPRGSEARQDSRDEPVELVVARACGTEAAAHRLREELSLRLSDVRLVDAAQDQTPWRLYWTSDHDDDHRGCMLVVESDDTRVVLQLDRHAQADDLHFVASRVFWIVAVDGQDPSQGLFGPISPGPEDVDQAHQAALSHSDEALDEARFIASALDDAYFLARDVVSFAAAIQDQTTGQDTEQTRHPGHIRISLLPHRILYGADVEAPRFGLNFYGSHHTFRGAEFGVLNHVTDAAEGAQFALAANVVDEMFRGAQFAGLANNARSLRGAQFAGAFNSVHRQSWGLQLTLGVNYAFTGAGVQLSPLANISRWEWAGAQVGLINFADQVRGIQFGLINISRAAAAPIGLINIATDYPPRIWTWYAAPSHLYTAFRMGGRYLRYGLVMGQRMGATGDDRRAMGLALGLHLPGERIFSDIDIASLGYTGDGRTPFADAGQIQQLRISVGWRFFPRFALVGGVGATMIEDEAGDGAYASPLHFDIEGHQVWPEIILGLVF